MVVNTLVVTLDPFLISDNKYLKLLMVQKSKQKNIKEKEVIKCTEKKEKKCNLFNKFPPKLPKLLPLTPAKKGICINYF